MCGIAGFVGTGMKLEQRIRLLDSLGAGIDSRGGHASGYVSVVDGKLRMNKRIGTWSASSERWTYQAARGVACMMHTRFATCGDKALVSNAHPFAIKRNGRTVLYGAHNGVLTGTHESAKAHNRPHTVDSRELFELLADGNIGGIQELGGYGVITYMKPDEPGYVYVCKLTADADWEAWGDEGKGVVWASTRDILKLAVASAKVPSALVRYSWKQPEVGRVYRMGPDGMTATEVTGVKTNGKHYARSWESYGSYERVGSLGRTLYSSGSSGSSYASYGKRTIYRDGVWIDADDWDRMRTVTASDSTVANVSRKKAEEEIEAELATVFSNERQCWACDTYSPAENLCCAACGVTLCPPSEPDSDEDAIPPTLESEKLVNATAE